MPGRPRTSGTPAPRPPRRPGSRCRSRAARRGPGTTRESHSPSRWSIDWNRPDDAGDPVVAAAPGEVVTGRADGTTRLRALGHARARERRADRSTPTSTRSRSPWARPSTRAPCSAPSARPATRSAPHLHFEERDAATACSRRTSAARPFVFGSTLVSQNCVDVPLAGNFVDGPEAEVAVFRRGSAADVPGAAPGAGAAGDRLRQRRPTSPSSGTGTATGRRTRVSARPAHSLLPARDASRRSRGSTLGAPARPAGRRRLGRRRPLGGRRAPAGHRRLRAARRRRHRTTVALGDRDDLPVTGDWDGDGAHGPGRLRPGDGDLHAAVVDDDGLALDRPGALRRARRPAGDRRLGRQRHAPRSASGTRRPRSSPQRRAASPTARPGDRHARPALRQPALTRTRPDRPVLPLVNALPSGGPRRRAWPP